MHHLNVVLYFVYWSVLLAAMVYVPRDVDWASNDFVYVKSFLEFTRVANMLNACNAFLSWFKVSSMLIQCHTLTSMPHSPMHLVMH